MPLNRSFLFAPANHARATRIVEGFREADAKGLAAIQVDGPMIDYPIVYQAQRVLEAAKLAG